MDPERSAQRRPRFVTWLSLGVLTLGAFYLTRGVASLSAPPLPLTVPIAYLTVSGAVWGGSCLTAAAGLWTGRRWAPALAKWGGLLFCFWYWTDRLLLVQSEFARNTRSAVAAATAAALAILWWGLSQPRVRRFFQESSG